MGKKSGLNAARKKRENNFDFNKLQNLMMNTNLHCQMEQKIEDKNFIHGVRNPDLLLNKWLIVEHDTVKIHGELGFENERTKKRNNDYHKAGMPFIVINEDLAKYLKLDEVKLMEYLYYHKLMEKQLGLSDM